jgi:hypothetical protein
MSLATGPVVSGPAHPDTLTGRTIPDPVSCGSHREGA